MHIVFVHTVGVLTLMVIDSFVCDVTLGQLVHPVIVTGSVR